MGTHLRVTLLSLLVTPFKARQACSALRGSHLAWSLRKWVLRQRQTTGSYREKKFPGSGQKEGGTGTRIQSSKNLRWHRCIFPHLVTATVS